MQTSLRGKIFLRFTLLVGLAIIATGICSIVLARNTIENRITAELLLLAESKAQEIHQAVAERSSLTRLLALDDTLAGFLHRGERGGEAGIVRRHLLEIKERLPAVREILVLDPQGIVRLATDSRREGEKRNTAITVGTLHPAKAKKRTHDVVSLVQGKQGEFLGVVVVEFDLWSLYEGLVWNPAFGETGEYLLVDLDGAEPACFNPREALAPVLGERTTGRIRGFLDFLAQPHGAFLTAHAASPICYLALANEGILSGSDSFGREVLGVHRSLRDLHIGILATIEKTEMFRPVGLLIAVLGGATGILLLLVTFVALRLSRDVTNPILRLRESLRKLDTGHWSHVQSTFTGDELEMLDRETVRLAARLEEAYTSLEKRVEERTQELAEAAGKDEALLESIGEGVLAMDRTGKIITCNHAAEHMLQWEREQVLGGHFSSCLLLRSEDGKVFPPHEHLVQRSIDQRTMTRTSPHRTMCCERKDGTTFPISLTAMPFLIGMEMKGVVVTFRDITEEKKIDTMKTEFISLASHQLRTPLTAIGWYIELLQKEAERILSEEQKDYIAQIVDSHRRMVDLVNALLNVSRIELGRLKIDPEKTNMRALVDATVRELTPQIQAKQLHFKARLPQTLEAFIDPHPVQIVLENLLSNAVKYTPAQGFIELNLIVGPREMTFEVQDTGYGIPKEEEPRIFEKLFRAGNVLKTDTIGTGLGLYISKSSTEAWGGKLWFESEEGKGSTFHFTVPMQMKKTEGAFSPRPTEGRG